MSTTRPLVPQKELSALAESAGPGGRTTAADAVGGVVASAAATTRVAAAAPARASRDLPGGPPLPRPGRPLDARTRDAFMNAPYVTSERGLASPQVAHRVVATGPPRTNKTDLSNAEEGEKRFGR